MRQLRLRPKVGRLTSLSLIISMNFPAEVQAVIEAALAAAELNEETTPTMEAIPIAVLW